MIKNLVKPLDYFVSDGAEKNIHNHEQRIHKYLENIKQITNKEKATERLLAVDVILAKLNQEINDYQDMIKGTTIFFTTVITIFTFLSSINEFIESLIPTFLLIYGILVLFSLAFFISKKSIYTTRKIYYEAYKTLLTQHINKIKTVGL